MAPKKKKGGKRKKKATPFGGIGAAETPKFVYEPPVLTNDDNLFVNLNVKLVTWSYLNFSVKLPTTTRLLNIIEMIRERHAGGIEGLVLYKDIVKPENIISGDLKTLKELGFNGAKADRTPTPADLFYDFNAETVAVDKLTAERSAFDMGSPTSRKGGDSTLNTSTASSASRKSENAGSG